MQDIITSILQKIKPSKEEVSKLKEVSNKIIEKINKIAKELKIEAYAILVGSADRGTWISGEHDLDIFITFPEYTPREDLEKIGLYIAKKAVENYEERYAEHPYIHAYEGQYEIDIVPCFRVSSSEAIKSAVDRTPFHNLYVKENINGLEDEVLLLKQFCKGIGVYGSELKTQGFSGYLCELLIIYYKSFIKVLKSACDWHPNIVIDLAPRPAKQRLGSDWKERPEKHGSLGLQLIAPLIVIDPVDKGRNVAAAVSLDKFCEFIDASRSFLENPSEKYFFATPDQPLSDKEFLKKISERGTNFFVIEFKVPSLVEDILYPQLRKMENAVIELIKRHDFRVFRSEVCTWNNTAVILLEIEIATLPNIKKHLGPPVSMKIHADRFKNKYKNKSDASLFSGPYIKNGKYVVEIKRKYTNVLDLLESELHSIGLGKHISKAIEMEYRVLVNEEIINIKDQEFRSFLRHYFRCKV